MDSRTSRQASWRRARDPVVARRALAVALVVGTVLNVINQFDVLTGRSPTLGTLLQIALTYLVPYVVSTHGQVWATRAPPDAASE